VLAANSVYLASITFLEWLQGDANTTYQNYFYMLMFGAHLVLGLLFVLPVVAFGIVHIKNAHDRPNRRAVRVGYLLFAISLALLFTGVALMRFDFFSIKNPNLRAPLYWAHVIAPVLRCGFTSCTGWRDPARGRWACAGPPRGSPRGMVPLHSTHPRSNPVGSKEEKVLSRRWRPLRGTSSRPDADDDDYCRHGDAYQGWFHSAHHFSSFNNKPYLFSVKETRRVSWSATV
jgi:hypothetical protein